MRWKDYIHTHTYYANTDLFNFFTANFTAESIQIESKQKGDFNKDNLNLPFVCIKPVHNQITRGLNDDFFTIEVHQDFIKKLVTFKINSQDSSNDPQNIQCRLNNKNTNIEFQYRGITMSANVFPKHVADYYKYMKPIKNLDKSNLLICPMPGKLIKILVKENQIIEEGAQGNIPIKARKIQSDSLADNFNKKVEKLGLPIKENYTVAEAKKILNKNDFNDLMAERARVVHKLSVSTGTIFANQRNQDFIDSTIPGIQEILEKKNIETQISDAGFEYFAEQVTGEKKYSKMNQGQKDLLASRLKELPRFDVITKFPDFRPRPYTVKDVNDFYVNNKGKTITNEILKNNIEDAEHNTTRFLIMARDPQTPSVNIPVPVTTIIFEVRSVPAALYKVLGGFATNGINLTKLESYIGGKEMNAARFYVDAEGHPDTKPMQNALEEMYFYSEPNSVKIIGTYSRAKKN